MKIYIFLFLFTLPVSQSYHHHSHHLNEEGHLEFLINGDIGDIWNFTLAKQNFDAIDYFVSLPQNNPKFFIELGDNIYDVGIDNATDYRFDMMYDLFRNRTNLKDMPVYPVLGNHDCYSNATAQVLASNRTDNNWEMPSRYYSHLYDLTTDPNGPKLAMLFLDGCQLNCISDARSKSCTDISDIKTDSQILQHYNWIDNTIQDLKRNHNIKWTVLANHWPLFASTDRQWNSPAFMIHLMPILQKHKIDIFLAGHSHNLQYFHYPYNTFTQDEVEKMLKQKEQNTGECINFYGEILNSPSRQYSSRKGETLNSFVVGAGGKHSLQGLCQDYKVRNIGHLQYGYNGELSFARAFVDSNNFKIQFYNSKIQKLYEVDIFDNGPSIQQLSLSRQESI